MKKILISILIAALLIVNIGCSNQQQAVCFAINKYTKVKKINATSMFTKIQLIGFHERVFNPKAWPIKYQ